jgi:WD40 repeat protein
VIIRHLHFRSPRWRLDRLTCCNGHASGGNTMSRSLLLMIAGLLGVSATVIAKPVPREKAPQAITVENANQVVRLTELPQDVWEIVFGPKPRQVIFLDWEKAADVFDAKTLKPIGKIGADKRLIHIACDMLRDRVAYCENSTVVEIVDLRDGRTTRIDTGSQQPRMQFSPNGKLLATGGAGTQAKLWEVATGKAIRSFDVGPTEGGLTVQFSPDGKLLAVGHRNATTRVFEVETGKALHTLPKNMSQGLRFSPDGKTLAITYVDGSLALWNVADGKVLHERRSSAQELYRVSWSAGGDVLVTSGRQGRITLWKAADLSVLKEFDAPEWVIEAQFTPDGSRILTASGSIQRSPDRQVMVWGLPGARRDR